MWYIFYADDAIALPLRQRWNVAIQSLTAQWLEVKDERKLNVLLIRGELSLMASREEKKSPSHQR